MNPPFNVSKIDKERLASQLDLAHRDFTLAQIEFIAPAGICDRKHFASLI